VVSGGRPRDDINDYGPLRVLEAGELAGSTNFDGTALLPAADPLRCCQPLRSLDW
jgi:hypothetical protein